MRLQLIKAAATAAFCAAAIACGAGGGAGTNSVVGSNSTPAAQPAANNSPATQTVAAKSGKELYAIHCMTCHKDSGKGGKVTVDGKNLDPDDLTTASMKAKSDEKMYKYIADGIVDEGMPAFKDELKPDEIKAVVAHLRTL